MGSIFVSEKVRIVGIADDGIEGLSSAAKELIATADVIIGTQKPISCLRSTATEKVEVCNDIDDIVSVISKSPHRRIVVLTLGDPLFFGTATYLCQRLGKERFEVVPHVSIMQLAFARLRENWDEAYLSNLGSQDLSKVIERIRVAERVGLFTTEVTNPSVVARSLLDRGIDYFNAFVCENLGAPNERVTSGSLEEIAQVAFGSPNVLVLVRRPDIPDQPVTSPEFRIFGNRDEVFLQSKPKRGLLTPAEVRTLAIAELSIHSRSVVWDVGAGSGSVAIEAAQIAMDGTVYAIEMDPEDYDLIAENAQRFNLSNLNPVLGKAPEVWASLPAPDSIFVGGTGRSVREICELAFARLAPGGSLVANVGSVENVTGVFHALHPIAEEANVWMVNVARGNYQLESLRFESLTPTFIVAATKPSA